MYVLGFFTGNEMSIRLWDNRIFAPMPVNQTRKFEVTNHKNEAKIKGISRENHVDTKMTTEKSNYRN